MNYYKNSLTVLFVLFSMTSIFGQDTAFRGTLQDKASFQKLSELFSNYEVVRMKTESMVDYITEEKDDFVLGLLFSRDYSFGGLRLYENDVRSHDYIVRTRSREGEALIADNSSDNISFIGYNNGIEKVVLSITNNFISGFIEDFGIRYYIEPLRHLVGGADVDLYAIYKESDVIDVTSYKCMVNHVKEKKEEVIVESHELYSDCYKVRFAVANDFSLFVHYGQNETDLQNQNISIMNIVSESFDDEFNYDITFEIVEQLIVTSGANDPWQTNTNDSRIQYDYFAAWGEAGGFNNSFNLGTLWTNREFTVNANTSWGGLNGLYIDSKRYTLRLNPNFDPFPQMAGVTGLARHEIGHNFGARHTAENCNMRNFFASCWTSDNQARMNATIAESIDQGKLIDCNDCGDGILTFDPTNIDCPLDPFQVCGTFVKPTCIDTSPVFSLNILNGSGNQIGNSITNSTVNNSAGTFCFTVEPSDFGDDPMGDFEFEVIAVYSAEISTQETSANDGPDASFNDCAPPCPKAGPDVNLFFCNNDVTYNLAEYLVDADTAGFWAEPYSDGLFNPSVDGNFGSNSATYTIPASIDCDEDSAVVTIAIHDCTDTGGYNNGNWYFGTKAGLSFNGNTTSVLLNGQTPQQNHCTATASDADGNLLFYTNGNTVWNKQHDIMEGGNNSILASNDKDQSVVVLPIPNSNKYYIFTEKITSSYNDGTFNSIYYFSVVNLDENDGLGLIEQLNTELFRTSFIAEVNGEFTEFQWAYHHNMTTALHADGESYWLILRPSNALVAFHITEAILSALPEFELSTLGEFNYDSGCSTMREYSMKASPRGDKLAYVATNFGCLGLSTVRVLDFDNASGLITGGAGPLYSYLPPIPYYSSIEFSSSGDILYGDYREASGNHEIHAYDLNNIGSDPLIIDSGLQTPGTQIRGNFIQRAVDGDIYSMIGSSSTLISRLTNINDIDNVNLSVDDIDLTRDKGQFPQNIPLHGASYSRCAQDVSVTRDVLSGHKRVQSAQGRIVLTNEIKAGAVAEFSAGSEVILGAYFHIEGGSQFKSFIQACQ